MRLDNPGEGLELWPEKFAASHSVDVAFEHWLAWVFHRFLYVFERLEGRVGVERMLVVVEPEVGHEDEAGQGGRTR